MRVKYSFEIFICCYGGRIITHLVRLSAFKLALKILLTDGPIILSLIFRVYEKNCCAPVTPYKESGLSSQLVLFGCVYFRLLCSLRRFFRYICADNHHRFLVSLWSGTYENSCIDKTYVSAFTCILNVQGFIVRKCFLKRFRHLGC